FWVSVEAWLRPSRARSGEQVPFVLGGLRTRSARSWGLNTGGVGGCRQVCDGGAQTQQGFFKCLEPFPSSRGKSLANRLQERLQIPFRVFVAPKELGINQKPELVTGPVQDCFSESHAVVAKKAECFRY